MAQEKCLICEKHGQSTFEIFRDAFLVVNHFVPHPDENDNYLGYYMIESRRHFKGIYDATDEEAAAIGQMMRALGKAMKTVLNAAHVYSFVMGDGIDHLHVHMVARYAAAPREYYGPKVDEWPSAPRGGAESVQKINRKVAEALRGALFENEPK